MIQMTQIKLSLVLTYLLPLGFIVSRNQVNIFISDALLSAEIKKLLSWLCSNDRDVKCHFFVHAYFHINFFGEKVLSQDFSE